MKKPILLSVVLLSIFVVSASAQAKVRVKFAKNHYEKTVSGSVSGSNYVEYVIRIERYNFIEAELKSVNKNLKFTIRNTKGVPLAEGTDVRNFSGEAERTGDYTIRVSGNGKYRLRIAAFMGT